MIHLREFGFASVFEAVGYSGNLIDHVLLDYYLDGIIRPAEEDLLHEQERSLARSHAT